MNPCQIARLDHTAVAVTDVDRARRFYAAVLGMTELPRPPSFDFPGAWFQIGPPEVGHALHLLGQPTPDPRGRRHFCMWTTDLLAAANHITSAGGKVEWKREHKIAGIDRFFVYDPDGNRIEFQGPELDRLPD